MSSKRRIRRKQCEGKIKYVSKTFAYGAVTALRAKTGHTNLGVYHCKFCKNWHIGHHKS